MKEYVPLSVPLSISEQVWSDGTLPIVDACVTTYMHEKYIRDCIEGILMQKTTFPVQILIHDDASADKTAEIIMEYKQKYPVLIKVFIQAENSQTKEDRAARRREFNKWRTGKYKAICDGDDYWTDPSKLQKQFDFLEENSEYGMCYTKAHNYIQEKKVINKVIGSSECSFEELIYMGDCIPTSTMFIRKELISAYLADIEPGKKDWKMGDYPLILWFSINSKIGFLDEITGIYRVLKESSSHFNSYKQVKMFGDSIMDVALFFINKYNICVNKDKLSLRTNKGLANWAIIFNNYTAFRESVKEIKKVTKKGYKILKIISKSKYIFFFYAMCYNKFQYNKYALVLYRIIKRIF